MNGSFAVEKLMLPVSYLDGALSSRSPANAAMVTTTLDTASATKALQRQ